ncbi:hypothetical protein P7K49_025692, partial [Saguinus oedipus]
PGIRTRAGAAMGYRQCHSCPLSTVDAILIYRALWYLELKKMKSLPPPSNFPG